MVNSVSRSPDIIGTEILSQESTGMVSILVALDFATSGPLMSHLYFEQGEGAAESGWMYLKNGKLK